MSKAMTIIEKIIGTVLTAWGMVVLYNVLLTVLNMVNSGFTTSLNITYLQLFEKNHLNLFTFFSCCFCGSYALV